MEEKEQTSELDSDMAKMLQLQEHEFKIMMINTPRVLMGKVDSI